MSKCSSSAMTSSTVSSESAPRSSMNFALGVTSSSSTPSCSQMISFTFSSTALAISRSPPSRNVVPSHVQTAVDVEDLPRDVGGSVSGEESYHFRHLAGGSNAPHRHLGQERLAGGFRDRGAHVG